MAPQFLVWGVCWRVKGTQEAVKIEIREEKVNVFHSEWVDLGKLRDTWAHTYVL